MNWQTMLRSFAVLTLSFSTVACGLANEIKVDAAKVGGDKQDPGEIKTTETRVAEIKAGYKAQANTDEFVWLKPYAEREDWTKSFTEASVEVAAARKLFDTDVQTLLDANRKKDGPQVNGLLNRIRLKLKHAHEKARVPGQRIAVLVTARDSAPQWMEASRSAFTKADATTRALDRHLAVVKKKYPDKKEDIDTRFSAADSATLAASENRMRMEHEFAKIDRNEVVDYAAFADSYKEVLARTKSLHEQDKALRSRVSELDKSYSKTLIDMRVDCFVTIGRASWDDYSDWDSSPDYTYPAASVPCATAEYFDGIGEGTVATHRGPKVDQGHWSKLGIDLKASWYSGDNAAEYWVHDVPMKYYHRYTVTTNASSKDTDWVTVSAELYDEYWDDLGMDILSKPYGEYEEDAEDTAAPPGMAYVDNPQYGEWQQDSSGNRFWAFYGQYMFMSHLIGPSPYYYSSYHNYHTNYRGHSAYYGVDRSGSRRFGASGTATRSNSRYSKSTFTSRGGFKRAPSSVRGAGATSRGGGPGGGGK